MQSIDQKTKEPTKSRCLCKAMRPTLYLCRVFGIFPLISDHVSGHCVFKVSKFWLVYSILRVITYLFQLIYMTDLLDVFNIGKDKSLHLLLSDIIDILYDAYITLLCTLFVIRYPNFIKAFNQLLPILHEGLLCQSALKAIQRVQYIFVGFVIMIFAVQYMALAWLQVSENFHTDFSSNTVLNKFSQNFSFVFYILFLCICSIMIGVLGCYERLVVSSLRYKPVHPMEAFEQVHMSGDFMGIIKYVICEEAHPPFGTLKQKTSAELIEYLRYLHEEISQVMYQVNVYLNPQLLVHSIIELGVLIIHWYAVIIYLVYNFSTPLAAAIHLLNCFFVVFHSLGLFVFLKCAQHQHNIVKEITRFFLEYSTRISTPEEHQQIRLMVDKIQLHKPLTASGIFTVDLGIAGPICANILTYVLVALQFDVTKT